MKNLYLLRGLPGSGKSTLAREIGDAFVEADMFFMSVILMLIEQVFLGDLVVKCPWALHYRSE